MRYQLEIPLHTTCPDTVAYTVTGLTKEQSITADSDTPPARLVRLLKALADERRLRVVKRMATGSYTLQEIADEFGVAKTTMQHHLTSLRQAGIVRMKLSDHRYSLRSEALDNLSELLGDYVKKTGDGP